MEHWIRQLSSADSATRQAAAVEIFRRGRELALAAIEPWLADETLKQLFVMGSAHFPEATVGVAVEAATFEMIRKACGSPRLAEVPLDQDVQEFELEFPAGVRLDILTPREREGSGALARHLRKFGESIQQVELLVKNVDRATQLVESHFQAAPVYSQTRSGANGTRINFFLLPAPHGNKVLIELVEAETPA